MTANIIARQWRENHGLSLVQLSRLTGWGASVIGDIERGHYATGKPIPEPVMLRYKLACKAITFKAGFDWDRPIAK